MRYEPGMKGDDLRERTFMFALAVSKHLRPLFSDPFARTIASQLLRSAWSVAANYRVTKHARSNADFASKMSVVAEEAEESAMWLEGLRDLALLEAETFTQLHGEADEFVAIAVASVRTARRNAKRRARSFIVAAPSLCVLIVLGYVFAAVARLQ